MTRNNMQRIFHGKWITTEDFCDLVPVNVFHRQLEPCHIDSLGPQNSHILFRKWFEAANDKQTYIYISADDYYKLYINGSFVCQGPAPGYPFHYYYNKVDITPYLKNGRNLIAVHSYYQGLINRVWVSGDDRHGLILDIEQDRQIILSSDESFLCARHTGFEPLGTVGYSTQFMEKYVSGTLYESFEKIDYEDHNWQNAKLRQNTDYTLYEQPSKMLVFEDIQPTLFRDDRGITADFGAIYVGSIYAEATGTSGDRIEIFAAQELEDDNSLRWKLRCNCEYKEEWILSGGEDILNQFDYKAFRYVRFDIPEGCTIHNISLKARHYPFELKARPGFQDEALLPIWNLCANSIKYGVQEVIQDCMDREKGNYLGMAVTQRWHTMF